MTAQDLKNSILQLAIQGKLVEQRLEDGSVKELLEQIKADKEGSIKKEKPLPEITEDEIPFEIPKNWEWVRLGDVLNIARGASPRPINEYITASDSGFNWIKIGDTDKGGKYINQTNEKITLDGMKKSRYVKKGNFLLSNSMSFGRPYILNIDGCIHDGWLVLSQVLEVYEMNYLYYLLSSKMVYNQFCGRVSGAVVNNLNSDKVKLTVVPIPPLEEQKHIVAKIEELLSYVEQYDKAYSKLETFNKKFPEDMQKSILQYAIQGKLVEQRPEEGTAEELYQHIQSEKAKLIKEGKIKKEKPLGEITDEEIPFEIPESWKWVYLNDISFVTKLAGFEYTKYMADAIKPAGEVPIIRAKNIKPNRFIDNNNEFISYELSEKLYRCALDKRCVLMTFIGAGIGEVAVFENKKRYHLAPNVAKIVPHLDINDYLLNYFMSPSGRMQIFQYMKQTAQPSLSMETIRLAMVPIPPLSEQKRIVKALEEYLPYCQQLIK